MLDERQMYSLVLDSLCNVESMKMQHHSVVSTFSVHVQCIKLFYPRDTKWYETRGLHTQAYEILSYLQPMNECWNTCSMMNMQDINTPRNIFLHIWVECKKMGVYIVKYIHYVFKYCVYSCSIKQTFSDWIFFSLIRRIAQNIEIMSKMGLVHYVITRYHSCQIIMW